MEVGQLRDWANTIGLHGVGIAPAIKEVRAVFPWARSVISCAISYLPPEKEQVSHCAQGGDGDRNDMCAPRGVVARFARGADYHKVLREKLTQLCGLIKSRFPQARLEVCVDTTPIPERKLAVLAGIGWRGWNSNVFVEGCGSWVSLGEIVTDLDLLPAKPLDIDRCSDCGLCMRSCPTGAIVAPYVIDHKRCLSYVTQSRSAIPSDLKPKLENRIYGCDTCQEVCPQNAGVKPITPEFAESCFPGANPELIPLVRMTQKEFEERVKHSSIGWIGLRRLRRNAKIALENLGFSADFPGVDCHSNHHSSC